MLSREFLLERGYCCGHGCLMCPYIPKHKKGNTNTMINHLGDYLFQRICNDQETLQRKRPKNIYGLYITKKDIQKYVWDYFNIGLDETGVKSKEENYWDDRDEVL